MWRPDGTLVRSEGPVQITYRDPATGIDTVMTGSDLDFNQATGHVKSTGLTRIVRPDATFEGYNVDYDLNAQVGRIENAVVVSDYFRMSGDVIEQLSPKTFRLRNGDFTTCLHGRPDYRLHVKDLIFQPRDQIKAHNVRIYLGSFALPTVPLLKRSLSEGSGFPLPTPSYNKQDGLAFRLQDQLFSGPHQSLDYDVRVGFRRLPTGFFVFQQDLNSLPKESTGPSRSLLPVLSNPLGGVLERITPPTFREYQDNSYYQNDVPRTSVYATLQNQQFVYNRRRTDLNVTRIPEVGIEFQNILGRPFSPNEARQSATEAGIGAAARYHTPNTSALLNVTAGIGQFIENPTHVSSGRLGIQASLASQPLLLGKRLSARAAVSQFLNVYTRGTVYTLVAPEAELDFTPTRTSLFNVAYRYTTDAGTSPFAFDQQDVRHELRLQYQVSGPWAFGVVSKIDLERSRAFDAELAVVRNFDCMQVGVVYRARSQSFGILFNLLPPRKDKTRPLVPIGRRPNG